MVEKALEQIRNLFEKGEYSKALDIIKLIPDSSKKTELKLWAFMSDTFYSTILTGQDMEDILRENIDNSYLKLLVRLASCKTLLVEIKIFFDDTKFSNLMNLLNSIEELYAHSYSKAISPEEQFLLEEAYVFYFQIKGNAILFEKQYEEGLQYYFRGLQKAQELHLNLAILNFYYHLTNYFFFKGKLKECISYAFKRLELASKINNSYLKSRAYNMLGMIYGFQGDKEKTIKYYKLAISNSGDISEIRNIEQYLLCLSNLGQSQVHFGLLNEGKSNLDQVKKKLEYYFNSKQIEESFFYMIFPDILMGLFEYWFSINDDEQCQVILSEFSTVPSKLNYETNINRYRICKAQYLLKKGRIVDKSTAFSLLKEIINTKNIYFVKSFETLLLLTELLLEDYENTKDQSIITEINSYIDNLNTTESDQININLSILISKMKLLEGKINEAEEILVKNLNKSNESGFYNEKQKIEEELAKLREEKTSWYELVLKNPNDLEKLQLQHFKNYLKEAKEFIDYSQINA